MRIIVLFKGPSHLTVGGGPEMLSPGEYLNYKGKLFSSQLTFVLNFI